MKLALASDLHLEFGDINLENTEGAEVLILSGDIMLSQELHDHPLNGDNGVNLGHRQQSAQRYRNFLQRCSADFKHVVYVAGNHEFYHGKWPLGIDYMKTECAVYGNVHFLENDTFKVDDVTFIGCTLWTDCNKFDPLTLHALGGLMNDFNIIRNSDKGFTKLKPAHIAEQHKKSMQYIKHVIDGKTDEKFVVVGHHAPSRKSTHPRYQHDQIMNGGYSSSLDEFIMDHPQIKLWTHGHTHHEFDYVIGETRIACNPRGYIGYEPQADEFKLMFMDI